MTTLTTPSTPRLSEVARHLVYPNGIVTSGWPRIKRRLAEMAVEYDGWQAGAAQLILGHDENGRYVATIGGVTMSIPRQVGKTFTVGSLLIAMCLEYPGLRVVWTSHHGRTTTNTFRAMQGMVRRKRVAGFVQAIRTANGEQEISFTNDSIIMFGAREHGFGVGIDAIDLLVCDEAQRLSSRALADMMPTTNQARHEHGALVFFIGTPPRPDVKGDEFAARRRKAINGEMLSGIYIEFSADEDGNFDDPEQWRKANASYPHRTPHESMLRLRENLTDEGDWRREAMGVWDSDDGHLAVIPAALWDDRLSHDPPEATDKPAALALDRWYDGATAISAAWHVEDAVHVEIVAAQTVEDTSGIVDWLVVTAGYRIPVLIVSDSPAAALAADLKARRVQVQLVTAADFARACEAFRLGVIEGQVWHGEKPGSQLIGDALAGAEKLPVGKVGGWVWNRQRPEVNIAPLVAATAAVHGAVKQPRRKSGRSGGGRRVVTG